MTNNEPALATLSLEEQIMGAFIYDKYLNSVKQDEQGDAARAASVMVGPRKDNYMEDDDLQDLEDDEFEDILLDDLDDDLDCDDGDLEEDDLWADDDLDADLDDLEDDEDDEDSETPTISQSGENPILSSRVSLATRDLSRRGLIQNGGANTRGIRI